jgi:hypothetical protein
MRIDFLIIENPIFGRTIPIFENPLLADICPARAHNIPMLSSSINRARGNPGPCAHDCRYSLRTIAVTVVPGYSRRNLFSACFAETAETTKKMPAAFSTEKRP